ncbi:membrane protein of ER body 2-like isoform X1 [Diospyros lotus]|uniref:membrane protein of ER body 2-like isoform X1 n=1 Tax=Diospyros lotus TaxID=55363 RepID=UPI002255B140|nr:membrane protein of ER body 2-like isoform X1 [Diospyros lotus]
MEIAEQRQEKDVQEMEKTELQQQQWRQLWEKMGKDETVGTESVYGFSVTENNGLFSASERSSRDDGLVIATENFDDQKSQSHVINDQTKEISNDGSFSHLGFLPSEKSSEKHKTHKSCSDVTVIFDDEHTVEIDRELTEFDVERILKKQNTHDLYCPNCNSCITRRVILRKRKRSIWIDRAQPLGASQLDTSLAPAQNYQGSGFKLFKKLGDKSEKENIQSPWPISEVKKNWFSSLFSSHAETTLVAQEGVVLDPADLGPVYELDMSNCPDEIQRDNGSDNSATQLVGKAMEHILKPTENATFEHIQDGLKILVHSSTDSLTVEISHMDEKENVTIKSKPAAGILLQQKALEHILKPGKNATFEHNQDGLKILVHSSTDSLTVEKSHMDEKLNVAIKSKPPGTDAIIDVQERPVEPAAAQGVQDIIPSAKTKPFPHRESIEARRFHGMDIIKSIVYGGLKGSVAIIDIKERPVEQKERKRDVEKGVVGTIIPPAPQKTKPFPHGGFNGMDIIRSIVYGGLVESITSLGVVLSAAGADATTLNILALGLANLIGGLFMIGQNLWELKNDHSRSISTETAEDASDQTSKQLDRYQELLGQRGKFLLHATFAILSHLIFGSLPPVIYGFSFRESDNRDFKLFAVAASSLLCIILLAAGKAYTQRPPRSFIKTVIYYVVAGFMARPGVSYSVGDQIKKLLEKLGWLSSDSALTLTIPLQQQAWGAYQDH